MRIMSSFRTLSFPSPPLCRVDRFGEYLLTVFRRLFFPPVVEGETTAETAARETGKQETDAELEAEAEAVASELPSAPTSDPSDAGHAGKKQKHEDY